jgi:hypothetical protein
VSVRDFGRVMMPREMVFSFEGVTPITNAEFDRLIGRYFTDGRMPVERDAFLWESSRIRRRGVPRFDPLAYLYK